MKHPEDISKAIYDSGRLNGELRMHAHDADSWHLPHFSGRIRCSDTSFHFWDATDDFSRVSMDLLFEGHRLYLHNAKGLFGAVPMTITGSLPAFPKMSKYVRP